MKFIDFLQPENNMNETSLSRVKSKLDSHAVGFITAFRDEYTRKENLKRNKQLRAQLQILKYNLTPVKGNYIEDYGKPNAKEVAENTFLVVSKIEGADPKLEKDLIKLGIKWDQDSILSVPFGKGAVLIGTNKTGYPGWMVRETKTTAKYGEGSKFFSRINGRKMEFLDEANGMMGRWAQDTIAEKDWRDIKL